MEFLPQLEIKPNVVVRTKEQKSRTDISHSFHGAASYTESDHVRVKLLFKKVFLFSPSVTNSWYSSK